MADLSSLSPLTEYRSSENDLVKEFYAPCLANAHSYDRAVGYFRSSVLLVVGQHVIQFARRGGHARIVASVDLTDSDVEAIKDGYERRQEVISEAIVRELDALLESEDTRNATVTLATLIATGAVDIRVALPIQGRGIFHDKLGIFRDERGNIVSFRGSSNESYSAWHPGRNHESFEVFWSWHSGDDRARIQRHEHYFETLWEDQVNGLEVRDLPDVPAEKIRRIAKASLDELETVSGHLTRTPLSHQQQALEGWERARYRGIFAHATGSGKTFTALIALKQHVGEGKPALVIVPSELLHRQWRREIEREIPEATVLPCGAGNDRWKEHGRLGAFTARNGNLGPRVVLTTIDTAYKKDFRQGISEGSHLLVVIDEVHVAGSRKRSAVLQIQAGKRLGLSATPERYGDPEGTRKIMEYFGSIIPPRVSLADAIEAGRLVQYRYHPSVVHLTASETEAWKNLTTKIASAWPNEDSGGLPDRVQQLLIKRSRIAKKAEGKLQMAVDTVLDAYEKGQYWLVYCEDSEQARSVKSALDDRGLDVFEYHTRVDDDIDQVLDWYQRFGGIVVSIRCLDEGVDIPETSHALILASSQNPREFIQRRGRVLRVSDRRPEKRVADVFDVLVLPPTIDDTDPLRSLATSEFRRAFQFANGALNRSASMKLSQLAVDLGIELEPEEHLGGVEDD